MAPPLNPHAQPYYLYPHVQSINYYVPPAPPCFFPPPVVLQNNTIYFHQYSLPQLPFKVLPNYSLHHKILNHESTSGFNLEVSAAKNETKQVIIKEEEEEVLVKRDDQTSSRVKFNNIKRCPHKNKCRSLKGQHKYPSSIATSDDDFRFKDLLEDAVRINKTTVMIKNIPNKLDKKQMLKLLDEHCLTVNKKLQADGGDHAGAAFSEFDFLYLPIDFTTGCNYGFAFVNLTTPTAAYRLFQEFHKKSWAYLGSGKVCEVTYARIQGLAQLLGRFSKSVFCCETKEYLPVHFIPNRNGFRMFTHQHYIGELK